MGNYADAASITTDQDQYQLIDNDGGFGRQFQSFLMRMRM